MGILAPTGHRISREGAGEPLHAVHWDEAVYRAQVWVPPPTHREKLKGWRLGARGPQGVHESPASLLYISRSLSGLAGIWGTWGSSPVKSHIWIVLVRCVPFQPGKMCATPEEPLDCGFARLGYQSGVAGSWPLGRGFLGATSSPAAAPAPAPGSTTTTTTASATATGSSQLEQRLLGRHLLTQAAAASKLAQWSGRSPGRPTAFD